MTAFFQKHREQWASASFVKSVSEGAFLVAGSIIVNHFASAYADIWTSNAVTDMILDNVPVVDVDGLLGIGALLLGLFLTALCLFEPRRIPFVLKSAALFILIRSGFIVLTHLGPLPDKTPLNDGVLFARLLSGNDLFFSGHTGLPFLMALVFWDRKYARAILLAVSFIFAAAVLLGHLHYSIDVFSAFFTTYSIFHAAQFFFRKDWESCCEI